jgi:tungstate transport system ATP-binding protein
MRDQVSILPLAVEHLSFEAAGAALLSDVSFAVPRGGCTVLLGPNGSGKSLTLRLCHGLIRPSGGRIGWSAGGGAVAGMKRHAMVFQKPVMLRRSAEANIVHALAAAGRPWRQRREAAQFALAHFGLSDLAARPARLLSGGEQQRLAIARAWALKPEVLFLDEPSSQLDPGATRQVEDMLQALKAEGVTLVMATHDLGQARRLADRVLFLHRGRLVEDATADRFFSSPASAEARAFIAGELLW